MLISCDCLQVVLQCISIVTSICYIYLLQQMAQRYPNMAKTLLSQQQMRYGQMRMKVSLNQHRATQLCMSLQHFKLFISFNNSLLIYIQGAPRGGLPPGASGMRAPFPGGGGPGMIRGKIPVRNASDGISINQFQQQFHSHQIIFGL